MKKIIYSAFILMIAVCNNSSAQSIPVTNGLVAHFDDAATNYTIVGNSAKWVDNISSIEARMNSASLSHL